MSLYLLDTNVLIDLAGEKSSSRFFKDLLQTPAARLATSVLCIAEYWAGAGKSEEKFLKDWLRAGELEVLPLDSVEDAMAAANLRKRDSLSLPDALILATAIRHRAHLLTHDGHLLNKAKGFLAVSDPLGGVEPRL